MIVSLDDTKNFLRVDFTDDDVLIQTLINAAQAYITTATGKVFDSTNPLAQTVCFMLIAEWYANREITRQLDAGPTSVLNTLLTQLAMSYDVSPPQVPSGLTALAEMSYVWLRWPANMEPSIDGYNVYRNGLKINVRLVREETHWMEWPTEWGDWPYTEWTSDRHLRPGVIAFRDSTVQAGQTYSYQVTAVDTLGNETAQSTAAQATYE
jgi:uncharacterized phage protein (predicted DNA packaging)